MCAYVATCLPASLSASEFQGADRQKPRFSQSCACPKRSPKCCVLCSQTGIAIACADNFRLEWINNHQCTSWGWARWTRFAADHLPARIGFFSRILPAPKFSTKNIFYLPPPTYHLPHSIWPHSIARAPKTLSASELELGGRAWGAWSLEESCQSFELGARAGPTCDQGKPFSFFLLRCSAA